MEIFILNAKLQAKSYNNNKNLKNPLKKTSCLLDNEFFMKCSIGQNQPYWCDFYVSLEHFEKKVFDNY
jgi:hypothetical protein